jgi:hypothetical protein
MMAESNARGNLLAGLGPERIDAKLSRIDEIPRERVVVVGKEVAAGGQSRLSPTGRAFDQETIFASPAATLMPGLAQCTSSDSLDRFIGMPCAWV